MTEKIYYPLTSPQLSIWYTEKMYPGTSISNIAGTLRIKEAINFSLMEHAINLFIKNNDGIRLHIVIDENDTPLQYVSEYKEQNIELVDFSDCEDPLKALYVWDHKMTSLPMDIIDKDLYRVYMIKISELDCGFYFNTHHLITDAWSINLLGSAVMQYYQSILNGVIVEDFRPSYIDYLEKEKEYFESERYTRDGIYWRSLLNEKPELTIIKSRSNNMFSTESKRKTFKLPKKFTNKLSNFCSNNKISKYQVFVAGLAAYIYRVTTQKTIIIGTSLLNRTTASEKKTVGMFVNTIPLKMEVDDEISFDSFIQKITNECISGLKHQKYPYEKILKETRQRHNMQDNLFDIVLSYQNSKFNIVHDVEYFSRWHFNGHQSNSLTIHINDRDDGGDLIIDYDYHENLYYEKEIEFIHNHILSLLWHALDNPNKNISKIEMISENEKKRILVDFNNTSAVYEKESTIHRIFEAQVERIPDKIALQFENLEMTYKELNEKANRAAWALLELGVKPDMPVGIMANRSFEMVIGIIAILKAGGAYLPIDPQTPKDRIEYLISNSGAKLIITSNEANMVIDNCIVLSMNTLLQGQHPVNNLPDTSNSRNLVYIIYTSGSTGRPKGVMIEHFSVVNRINWMQKAYPIDNNDCIIQKTPFNFDVSVWELFWWFFVGARLALLIPNGEKSPDALLAAIKKYHVTTMHFVPSMFRSFTDYLKAKCRWDELKPLKQIFASGEALPYQVAHEFIKNNDNIQLINLYGPTEAAIDVTHYNCTANRSFKSVPIGKPIDNIQLYILDGYLNLQPIGTTGELYISGDGLARGYINNPQLTEQRFLANPFLPGHLMYKTGDLARWYPKGDIEYIGRIDHQIKIRGHRIELNEIKHQILKNKLVRDVIVICKETQNEKHIYAYVIFNDTCDVESIRNSLRQVLPGYMIPSYIIEMDEFPLLSNGKTDINMLPKPRIIHQDIISPRNDLEKKISEIWKDVLKVDDISINSSFFDLGGDSLSAIQVITRMDNVSLEDIYQNPTIEQLSERIEKSGNIENSILMPYRNAGGDSESAIVCFPFGGGSGTVYKTLFDEISNIDQKCRLFSINLPGHELRGNNLYNYVSLDEASNLITERLIEFNIEETILYGHCVGAALTFMTAKKLKNAGIQVKAICLGGILPPRFAKYYGSNFSPWTFFSDTFVNNYLKKIGFSEDIPDEILPGIIDAFRYDVKCFYNFFNDISKRKDLYLDTPIFSIFGAEDPMTRNCGKRYKEWLSYTNKVSLKVIPEAGHYFIKTHTELLAQTLLDISGDSMYAAI